jgi:Leucine-rich repeat (LRR) protein
LYCFAGGVPLTWSENLQKLTNLQASFNLLTGPIIQIARLNALQYIDFSHNKIVVNMADNPNAATYGEVYAVTDACIGQAVIELHLDYNEIAGTWFGLSFYSTTLQKYTLSHNRITTLPPKMFNAGVWSVTTLDVSYNALR